MSDLDPTDGDAPVEGPTLGGPAEQPSPADDAEEDVWAGKPTLWAHPGRVFGSLVAALHLAIFAWITGWGWLGWVNGGLVPLLAAWAAFNCLYPRLAKSYRLTSQRLFLRRGWLSQTTDQIELIRVDDIRVRRGMLQRLLGVGDVVIYSTDLTDHLCALRGIRNAADVAEKVREHTRRMRKKSLFVEGI